MCNLEPLLRCLLDQSLFSILLFPVFPFCRSHAPILHSAVPRVYILLFPCPYSPFCCSHAIPCFHSAVPMPFPVSILLFPCPYSPFCCSLCFHSVVPMSLFSILLLPCPYSPFCCSHAIPCFHSAVPMPLFSILLFPVFPFCHSHVPILHSAIPRISIPLAEGEEGQREAGDE